VTKFGGKPIEAAVKKSRADKVQLINGTGFPLPSVVEFNIWGDCNRACSFCPVSTKYYDRRPGGMDFNLYAQIIYELMHLKFNGMILFSAFSEPLLNPTIVQFVRLARNFLPCHIEINTNGDAIRKCPDILHNLFKSGLNTVSISLYSNRNGPKGGFDDLIEMYSPDEIKIRRRYYSEMEKDFGTILSNRGGIFFSDKRLPLNRQCFYPFYQITIDMDGDMLLCPHDWRKMHVVGNLKMSTLRELWTGSEMELTRALLADKKRDFEPCVLCDVDGTLMGEGHYNRWMGGD